MKPRFEFSISQWQYWLFTTAVCLLAALGLKVVFPAVSFWLSYVAVLIFSAVIQTLGEVVVFILRNKKVDSTHS